MEHLAYWLSHYGYLGLFALLMLGIVGLPVPEETLLTFAGVLLFRGRLQLGPAMIAAFLGSCCGISVSYGLGRAVGPVLTRRFGGFLHVTPEGLDRVEAWFERVGHWTLLWGYFLPGIRHLTAVVAGGSRLRFPDFAIFAYSGAFVWSLSFLTLGAVAGRHWAQVSAQIRGNLRLASAAIVALLLLALVVRWALARKR